MGPMMKPLEARPPRPGCLWVILGLAAAFLGLGALLAPYLAFGVSRPPQDHVAALNLRLAEQARIAPADRAAPNAAAEALARAVELTYQAHEQGLGVTMAREFSPRWGLGFDGPTLLPAERGVIAAAERLGLFTTLDALAADPAVYAPFAPGTPPQAALDKVLEVHSALRQLARMNIARLHEAVEAADGPAAARTAAQNTGLGRAAAARPFALSRLVGIAILSGGQEELARAARAGKLPRAALPDLARTVAADPLPPAEFLLETERQFVLLSLDQTLGWSPLRSINRDAVKNSADELFDRFLEASSAAGLSARLSAFRAAAPAFTAICARSPLLSSLDQGIPDMLTRVERDFEERTTVARAFIAVERFRERHGTLPKALAELAPEFLPAPPVRPEGDALRYAVGPEHPAGYDLGPPPPAPAHTPAAPEAAGPAPRAPESQSR